MICVFSLVTSNRSYLYGYDKKDIHDKMHRLIKACISIVKLEDYIFFKIVSSDELGGSCGEAKLIPVSQRYQLSVKISDDLIVLSENPRKIAGGYCMNYGICMDLCQYITKLGAKFS